MRQDLDCKIVQDLLPNYIENLTSDFTNGAIKEHIRNCKKCSEMLDIMSAEISTKKPVPKKELKFLKKIKLTRVIAAAACVLLAFLFAYMLYASEYQFTSDKSILSAAITDYTSNGKYSVEDAYVLETKEIDGVLIAFFKDNNNPDVYGFARLLKGLNMKYRLVSANFGPSSYSSVVEMYKFNTNNGTYFAIGGYNCDENITSYGLRLVDDNYLGESVLHYNIKNNQFLDILKDSDLQKKMQKLKKEDREFFFSSGIALLDSEGNDITENYKISKSNSWGSSTGTAELFMLYVFISIVLILGFIFARYFLSEK